MKNAQDMSWETGASEWAEKRSRSMYDSVATPVSNKAGLEELPLGNMETLLSQSQHIDWF